jgi:hypothetical protein
MRQGFTTASQGWQCRRQSSSAGCLSRSVLAETGWSERETPRITSAARRQSSLLEHDSSHLDHEAGAAGRKTEKNSLRARRAPGSRCYNRGCCEPGSVPGSAQMGNVGKKETPCLTDLFWRDRCWLRWELRRARCRSDRPPRPIPWHPCRREPPSENRPACEFRSR